MKVTIKQFNVAMEVKNSGIELEIKSPDGKRHLGDVFVTKTGLVWCRGRTTHQNGERISWQEFVDYMES